MKVLVLTLYVDEPQINDCCASVESQKHVNFKHKIFSGLSAYESAIELHNYAKKNKDSFDYIIKLDADMVFDNNYVLYNMICALENTSYERLTYSVYDHISERQIRGVHIFKSSSLNKEHFISPIKRDNWLSLLNGIMIWSNKKKFLIHHSPNKTIKQSFLFGFNRGLKTSKLSKSTGAYEVLFDLYRCKNYVAIQGFLKGLISSMDNFDHSNIISLYEQDYSLSYESFHCYLKKNKDSYSKILVIYTKIFYSKLCSKLLLCF